MIMEPQIKTHPIIKYIPKVKAIFQSSIVFLGGSVTAPAPAGQLSVQSTQEHWRVAF